MNSKTNCGAIFSIALMILFCVVAEVSAQPVTAQTYSGRATGIKATVITGVVPGVTAAVTDTGPLPSAGGTITLASASANITNILTAGASTVTTSGSGGSSQSTASVAGLDVNVLGAPSLLEVRADLIASTTMCTCADIICTGSSTITNLRTGPLAGTAITVTGAANQTVVITSGTVTLTLVINEQISSPSSITVNALHITLSDSATGITTDVVVSSAHSDIVCLPSPTTDRYSGRATGVRLATSTLIPQSNLATIVADTGFLPTSGGNISTSVASASVPGILGTGVVTSNTSGGLPGGSVDTSQSDSTVNNLSLNLVGGVGITATLIQSQTQCVCAVTPPVSCAGRSNLVNLVVVTPISTLMITADGTPNQTITLPLGLGTIIINEQTSGSAGDITVNALHVILTPLGLASTDLVVASSHSDISCALSPSAGGVNITGQVVKDNGSPISGVRLSLLDNEGNIFMATSNPFGYFEFSDVPAGTTYFLGAKHRLYVFAPQTLRVSEDVADIRLTPQGGSNASDKR